MIFNFDWWFDGAYQERLRTARDRCAANRYKDLAEPTKDAGYQKFLAELETRTILYLRDGFSYEIKELIRGNNTTALTFECMPTDETYKVGCFIVTAPFDDVVRVEVFAVHPSEKPEDLQAIKGFAGVNPQAKRGDDRPGRENE